MSFLIFLVLLGIGYMLWRVMDQLPDVVFRLSEIQRDVAEIRRTLQEQRTEEHAAVGSVSSSGSASSSTASAASTTTPGGDAAAPGDAGGSATPTR